MIKIKHFFIYLFLFVLSLLFILIVDYIRINTRYMITKNEYSYGLKISGNKDGYIPQGLAYSEEYNVVLQTSYNKKNKVSKLYVYDYSTKEILKELKILNMDKTENKSHVGGIAVYDDTVWITSDYKVNEFSLEEVMTTDNSYVKSIFEKDLSIRGDFCTVANNQLLIGDFFLNPFYKVPNNTPLMYYYDISNYIDYDTPKYIATLPKMVQGLTVTEDNKYIFTKSFTYLINSDLALYDDPFVYEFDYYELNGNKIPLYHFNKKNLIRIKKLPPMAEGLFYKDKKLHILFESSSDSYFLADPKIEKLLELDINKIDRK